MRTTNRFFKIKNYADFIMIFFNRNLVSTKQSNSQLNFE